MATDLIDDLCDGDENAYHSALEAGEEILPVLVDRFRIESRSSARALIVRTVWQRRNAKYIGFLAEAFGDQHDDVWKESLDGLVAIGGAVAVRELLALRHRFAADPQKSEWLDEAIDQVG